MSVETATTSTPSRGPELRDRRADRRLAVAEVRAEPDIRAGHGARAYATLARLVGRRFLAVCAARALRSAAPRPRPPCASRPTRSSRRSGGSRTIGADPAAAPGPGVPITIVDSGTDPTHPEFAGRPNTTFLNDQTTIGRERVPRHDRRLDRGRAGERRRHRRRLSDRRAADLRREPRRAAASATSRRSTGIDAAAQHCPGVINLSFGEHDAGPAAARRDPHAVHNGCLVVAAAGNSGQEGSPPTYPAVVAARVHRRRDRRERRGRAVLDASSPANRRRRAGRRHDRRRPADSQTRAATRPGSTARASPRRSSARPRRGSGRCARRSTASQLAGVLRAGARDIGPPGLRQRERLRAS